MPTGGFCRIPTGQASRRRKRFRFAQTDDLLTTEGDWEASVYAALQHFLIGRFHIIKTSFVF
jgi:hypothetical protein